MEIKFPQVKVQLTGEDGNGFAIMGAVSRAMKRAGCTDAEVGDYRAAAMAGDYDNLLRVTMQTVEVA